MSKRIKICGIYKITSPNGSVYIGQSIDIHKRWRSYINIDCDRQCRIYNSLLKHGVENHNFEVIKECLKSELNKFEIYYIEHFNSFKSENGLNLNKGGSNPYVSEETRSKMRLNRKGRGHSEQTRIKIKEITSNMSAETKARMSESRKGHKVSTETRNKISLAQKGRVGRKQTAEIRAKISIGLTGRPYSGSTRLKISESNKGKVHKTVSNETKLKLSAAGMGRVFSDETKRKIGESNRLIALNKRMERESAKLNKEK